MIHTIELSDLEKFNHFSRKPICAELLILKELAPHFYTSTTCWQIKKPLAGREISRIS